MREGTENLGGSNSVVLLVMWLNLENYVSVYFSSL